MRVFLVHVRDPQFYAIPSKTRAANSGRLRVMGFPPIGIMSLSSVLKRAGHECVLFDQANPETPNDAILGEIARQKPDLVGLSFLSTTSYPYAKVLARQIRAASATVKIAMGGVFVTLNAQLVKLQCPEVDFVCRGDGEQLILDLLERLDQPDAVMGVTWQERDGTLRHNPSRPLTRDLDQWPFPDRESLELDFVESMPLDVPAVLSLDRFTTMQTSRGCPWPCVFCDIPIFNEGKWRSRSPEHVVAELKELQKDGYGAVYFVDDHFLLQPRRIEAICQGIIDNRIPIEWGCEGRVDSVCMQLFPIMAKAHCRTLMFGIESGSQKILDRLKKEQTLQETETAVTNAKRAGIEIVHGFFVVGNPDETEEDMRQTFRFASKLRIDSFGFNRLCVYRGTPLWQEYVQRGLVNDATDWYKYFKCSSIDPTVLPGEEIHRIRAEELRRLILYKLAHYPWQSLRLLRRFVRYMPLRDVIYLLVKPFLGRKKGLTNAEVVSRAVEHADLKSAAADLTQLADDTREHVIRESRAQRARNHQDIESAATLVELIGERLRAFSDVRKWLLLMLLASQFLGRPLAAYAIGITGIEVGAMFAGVCINGRDGLKELIDVVQRSAADFTTILVYDVSRWGRFQDAVESTYYEYICKPARNRHSVDTARLRPDQRAANLLLELVDLNIASWNPLFSWLRSVEALRSAAQFESSLGSHAIKGNKISNLQIRRLVR